MFSDAKTLLPAGEPGGALTVKQTPAEITLPEPVQQALRVDAFPTSELGPIATPVCRELCEHFGVPPDLIALAMLTIAGGMFGPRKADGWCGGSGPANLFSVCGAPSTSNAAAALECLIDPVHSIQKSLVRTSRGVDHAALRQELAKMNLERAALTKSGSAAAQALEVLDSKLASANPILRPLMLVEGLDSRDLLKALQRSVDGCLLHISIDGESLKAIGQKAKPREETLELLGRLVGRQPVQVTDGEGLMLYWSAPALSSFVLAPPATLASLLAEDAQLPSSLRRGVIVFDSGAEPAKITSTGFELLEPLSDWAARLALLSDYRVRGTSQEMLTMLDAHALIRQFHNDMTDLLAATPAELHEWLMVLPGLASRLSASLQLLQESPAAPATAATARTAIALAKWYGGKQLAAWLSTRGDRSEEKFHLQIEAVLMRIRLRGPISRRDLLRTFKIQVAAVHEPVLHALLAEGRVIEDEHGRLLAAPVD
jgi:hypothetical protein